MAFTTQFSALFLIVSTCLFTFTIARHEVSHDGRAITIDGQRRVLLSGSIHYPRSTPEMWPDLINKAKEGGLNTIETYVFWNAHEPARRQYDFTGNLDLVRFIKTIQAAGLYSVLRIGPYACAEWNYGGFPVWLHNMDGVEFRTNNDVFKNEMQNFTTKIVDMMKQEKLFAVQDGPIILAQIENEYGNPGIMSSYGTAGKAYVDWCAKFADSLNIGVPWVMCQQADAPQPMIDTCNGFYCHDFKPNNPNSPKMWTENWTGWFKNWGGPDPHRTAEDVAYAVAKFFKTGGTFQNYYMYHGGTNFGRASSFNITTSYDYDAPLDEYGNLNQPKYGHLKELHSILVSMEKTITYGNVTTMDLKNSVSGTMFTLNGTSSSCFFDNNSNKTDATIEFQGMKINVPAWSVSIFPDCKTEAYNTAKVNAQTSLMVKESNYAPQDKPASSLKWFWTPENIENHVRPGKLVDNHVILGEDQVSISHLVDKKRDNDASDYLWYMTSVDLDKSDPILSEDISLKVNGTNGVIHAYVNGQFLGSKWNSTDIIHFPLANKTKLNPGSNELIFLSATVGLKNYGGYFDLAANGIAEVGLESKKGKEAIVKDLSRNHTWTYKAGLDGFSNKIFTSAPVAVPKWEAQSIPTDRTMSWFKTTFKTPLGTDPVVMDLGGLGKGFAWVNGHNIGRYWPSYMADKDACSNAPCDYRGAYDSNKCVFNCGQPTQKWYHVPRDWLNKNNVNNELVLFEELGGNPSMVSFKTVRPGTICASVVENKTMELSCDKHPISSIQFVGFGDDTQGTCGAFKPSKCAVYNQLALKVLHEACVGKLSCSVPATRALFGTPANCIGATNKLVVQAAC